MLKSELIKQCGENDPELMIRIKTNITDGSGKKIDFIYEIDSIDTLLQAGESRVLVITGSLLKQNLR